MSQIRIMTASDLHFGAKWDTAKLGMTAEEMGDKLVAVSERVQPDVFYFGGDLSSPGEGNFERGLDSLSRIRAGAKLFTAGNHEVEQAFVAKGVLRYAEILKALVAPRGFHLLDDAPFRLGSLAFAGNLGWYDGSLWRAPLEAFEGIPSTREAASADTEKWFRETFHDGSLSAADFHRLCFEKITRDLDALIADPTVGAIVVGSHFVPSGAFVLYGDNPKFDFFNWYMGAQNLAAPYGRPKVVAGFTGHTHRSDAHVIGGVKVHNLSGPKQPRIFEVDESDPRSLREIPLEDV